MRVLIVGCGRTGAQLAARLWEAAHHVTVVDIQPDSFLLLPKALREQEGATFLGDGTMQEVLVRAGVENADVFVAVMGHDSANALAAQKAKHLFRVPQVILRVGEPTAQEVYARLDLEAICHTRILTDLILRAIRG